MTINRLCSSGLNAVAIAADRIRVGEADVMIAGGAESMSMVPMVGNKPSFNAHIFERDENVGIAYGMGMTAEKVAAQWKVSREAQDEFAYQSHMKAIAAQKAGEQHGDARHVQPLLGLRHRAADDRVLDRLRVERRHLRHRAADRRDQQVVGPGVPEHALWRLADRRARGGDDVGILNLSHFLFSTKDPRPGWGSTRGPAEPPRSRESRRPRQRPLGKPVSS
jgi:hypothetical protein